MSQASTVIPDTPGLLLQANLNAAFAALVTNNSGGTAPTITTAYQFWADTGSTPPMLRQRNAADTGWVSIGPLADLGIQSGAQSIATVGGTADALTLAFSPTVTDLAKFTGTFLFVSAADNVTTAPTGNIDSLGLKTFIKGNNLPLAVGDIKAGMTMLARYDSVLGKLALLNPVTGVLSSATTVFHNYRSGLKLSPAGGSATMPIGAGVAMDSANTYLMQLSSGINKAAGAWVVGTGNGGLDTGTIANSTWYHFHLIRRPDTGVVDILFSLSAASPTLPANYTQFRRIGSCKTNGSGQWVKIIQDGNWFSFDVPVLDVDATFPGTSAVARSLSSIPTGVRVLAKFNYAVYDTTNAGQIQALFSDLSVSDAAPSTVSAPLATSNTYTLTSVSALNQLEVWTDTSAQIRTRASSSSGTCVMKISVLSYYDPLGQNS